MEAMGRLLAESHLPTVISEGSGLVFAALLSAGCIV